MFWNLWLELLYWPLHKYWRKMVWHIGTPKTMICHPPDSWPLTKTCKLKRSSKILHSSQSLTLQRKRKRIIKYEFYQQKKKKKWFWLEMHNKAKYKEGVIVHSHSRCRVAQVVGDISSCIYLLQQPGHRERTVKHLRMSLHYMLAPRESSMERNRSHLHLRALGADLYRNSL